MSNYVSQVLGRPILVAILRLQWIRRKERKRVTEGNAYSDFSWFFLLLHLQYLHQFFADKLISKQVFQLIHTVTKKHTRFTTFYRHSQCKVTRSKQHTRSQASGSAVLRRTGQWWRPTRKVVAVEVNVPTSDLSRIYLPPPKKKFESPSLKVGRNYILFTIYYSHQQSLILTVQTAELPRHPFWSFCSAVRYAGR